ncbi:glycosyltransferase family 4 protein [Pseudodonghicola flavimaris]|uniref:Glycosyltransferase family 4 protein n=1 Tax=Pseudodonghicola flavimaris TaxID=3050036 RepID=A0ABT7F322_9RHOB|nr:glycosyltransferase family 4 protein [Pseudodonghicola flavimaris]MDK3019008.1 glycosyltransferase family 4 protein [Pseudodonghicola flavimaris]
MTPIAFYAPLKPPNASTPSGDREMARNLIAAIGAGGAEVRLVSDLRLHDKTGDPARQAALRRRAADEVARLIPALGQDRPALWVTYHNYYKAPDLIGPAVCAALDLPYVQLESTRAKKRLTGPWAEFAQAAEAACDAAAVIFYLTANDLITLDRHRPAGQRLVHLPPFLPADGLPAASGCDGPMLSAGMMRAGDKLSSYRIIAETLAHLPGDWRLEIAGDGPARAEVAALMARFGNRVRFLGLLDRTALTAAYARAGLFFWPGVNEAFGMVYLEAQAAGLPVVAQDRPGVRDVLLPGDYPTPEAGPEALARTLSRLLDDPALRRARGAEARAMIAATHLRPAATDRFWSAVAPLLEPAA